MTATASPREHQYFRPTFVHDRRTRQTPLDPRARFRQASRRARYDKTRCLRPGWGAIACPSEDVVFLFDDFACAEHFYLHEIGDTPLGLKTWYYGTYE